MCTEAVMKVDIGVHVACNIESEAQIIVALNDQLTLSKCELLSVMCNTQPHIFLLHFCARKVMPLSMAAVRILALETEAVRQQQLHPCPAILTQGWAAW